MLSDLLLGFFLSKLFGKGGGGEPAASRPAHVLRRSHAAATTQPSAFPAQVVVPASTTTAPEGFKKAIEIWAVRPDVSTQVSNPVLTGLVGQVNDATALSALEASFPAGWAPAQRVTTAEQQMARSLLSQWHDGGVVFFGPQTLEGIRAYRMTKHPKGATAPEAAPVPVPGQPGVTQPASVPVVVPPFVPGIPAAAPTSSALPTLQVGSSGPAVTVLQTKLKAWGTFTKMNVDGKFGPITKAAVITWQNAHSLTPDGVVGPQTWASLGGTDPTAMPAPAA